MATDYTGTDPKAQEYLRRASSYAEARFTSEAPLCLTESGDVVAPDDEKAAYVLVGAGGSIPQDLADDLGLKGSKKKKTDSPPALGLVTGGVSVINDDSAVRAAEDAGALAKDSSSASAEMFPGG